MRMLRLGFGPDYKGGELLQATFDAEQASKATSFSSGFENALEEATRLNAIRLLGDQQRTAQVDFAAITRKRRAANYWAAMDATFLVLKSLVDTAGREDNPRMFAEFCGRYEGDRSRTSLHAELEWPNVDDVRLMNIVTPRMQRVAKAIKLYESDFIIREEVGIGLDREEGELTFNTHILGGSMLGTGGEGKEFKIGDRIHVSPANLYSDEMAIVAFAGAVAFANAEELEPLPQI